ncbi:hypothetical protein CABS02_11711 [Colletotrichum abscissum]|uniref:Uncharacterized protein n=1 Tax=Colletotrichum abscissum TaxID=1671311 RepID=A0A9P9X5Y9_9PEZI|nr:hypothetical protein CABS02_11711 [Colletotrichum abscissum]
MSTPVPEAAAMLSLSLGAVAMVEALLATPRGPKNLLAALVVTENATPLIAHHSALKPSSSLAECCNGSWVWVWAWVGTRRNLVTQLDRMNRRRWPIVWQRLIKPESTLG